MFTLLITRCLRGTFLIILPTNFALDCVFKMFNFQVDMVEIKEQYVQAHKKTLADDIKEHFKEEDVRKTLLALIKGMSFVFNQVLTKVSLC